MLMRWRSIAIVTSVVAFGGLTLAGGSAVADDDTVRLDARLTGAQELPPADPDGRGRAKIELDVEGGQVCFDLRIHDTGAPNRGHIHVGDATQNGGIVVPLFELAATPTSPAHDDLERGHLEGCVPGDQAVLAAIAANPSGYYVNVHNARFPGGSMRCQLEE
jgi:hypothetical protein